MIQYLLLKLVCPGFVSPQDIVRVEEELKRADAIVLTYACDQPETLNSLGTFWLPELRELEVFILISIFFFNESTFAETELKFFCQVKAPVVIVGCKLDLRVDQQVNLEHMMSPIMQQFREIETCIECSAYSRIQV